MLSVLGVAVLVTLASLAGPAMVLGTGLGAVLGWMVHPSAQGAFGGAFAGFGAVMLALVVRVRVHARRALARRRDP